jgi:hypothetical protein
MSSGIEGREAQHGNHLITLKCSFTLARRRGELRLVLPGSPIANAKSTSTLVKAIVTAYGCRERIITGEVFSIEQLTLEANLNSRYVARIFRLAALSSDIVDGAIRDRFAADLSLSHFVAGLPLDWNTQRSLVGRRCLSLHKCCPQRNAA